MSSRRLPGRPLLIVLSSPSGGGKSTLCRRLLSEYDGIEYSISCTTRAPRGDEKNGESYFFMDSTEFEEKVAQGLFLEHAEVHEYRYGTLKSTIEDALSQGDSVILDIDVQGAAHIRTVVADADDMIAKSFLDIFITPPSLTVLRERLEQRGEDSAETVEVRLANAEKEMRCASDYSYVIENDDIEQAYRDLVGCLEKESSQ